MRILLSGATGLIGSALRAFLADRGHEIFSLTRSKAMRGPCAVYWNPLRAEADLGEFEGFDAWIHLAGENVAAGRWTRKRKRRLFQSRTRDTWLLSQIFLRLHSPPRVVIVASAVGYYGDRGEELLTEESPPGQGFLAELCGSWEAATRGIESRGVRTLHLRFGGVLDATRGMLARMLPVFRWGLGGIIGSGTQILSWIALEDVVASIDHLLQHEEVSGAVNLVSPHPVTQACFAKTLGSILHRPTWVHTPGWLLRLLLGQMARELLLASLNVRPKKLLESGYNFRYPELEGALRCVLRAVAED